MLEIVGPITDVKTFATENTIRELARLKKMYGFGHWRKQQRHC